MRLIYLSVCVIYYFGSEVASQQAVDPAYLRQYYAQLQKTRPEAVPIHEPESDQPSAAQYQAPVSENVLLRKNLSTGSYIEKKCICEL